MHNVDDRERPLVMVADDEEDVRNLVALQLERHDFDVVRAANGEEALKLAQEERPDAAVLDVMMPGMNGYEVVSQMRKAEETKHIPVLLLTARAGGVDVMQGYQSGADDYMKKPFTPQDLLEHVQALLGRGAEPRV